MRIIAYQSMSDNILYMTLTTLKSTIIRMFNRPIAAQLDFEKERVSLVSRRK